LAEVRQVLDEAKKQTTLTGYQQKVSQIPGYITEKMPSMLQKIKNVFKDYRMQLFAKTLLKGMVLVSLLESAAFFTHLTSLSQFVLPLSLLYITYEAFNSVYNKGLILGPFTNLHKEVAFSKIETPLGMVRSGEVVGSIHLGRSLGKMSDMSLRERAVKVPLDGLLGLQKLGQKFEQGSSDVADVTAVRARSHLVAQNSELFKNLGFSLEEQSEFQKDSLTRDISAKMIVAPVWGIRQLLKGRGLRGFKQANALQFGKSQTAWILPSQLIDPKNKEALNWHIQRFQQVAAKLERSSI